MSILCLPSCTVARVENVNGHEDRVVIAGAVGIDVVAEDAAVHFAIAREAGEFDLAFEQACAANQMMV